MTRTKAEKNGALFRVLYDLALLSDSIRLLKEWQRKPRDKDLNEQHIALTAALLKMRVLYDFLYRSHSRHKDEVFATDLDPGSARGLPPLTAYEKRFRDATNKWCAHLSWYRLTKDYLKPTPKNVRRPGDELILRGKTFVEQCLKQGFSLPARGRKYLARIEHNARALKSRGSIIGY